MKEIKAVVQTSKLQKIHDAFHRLTGFPGIVAGRVDWFGPHGKGLRTPKEELTDFSKRTYVVILAEDDRVDDIVKLLIESTYTGQPGDGTIWVTAVEKTIEIGESPPRGKA
ncbi:MAG TPA: P-II family nitrogen regulator [Thermodesulfobacteriota bacterium]|nr:P-II family nitrogen regulator [Thermodesulfobacteriota bacterium]